MLTIDEIQNNCAAKTFVRGRNLFDRGNVGSLRVDDIGEGIAEASAWVTGSGDREYRAYVDFDYASDTIYDYFCECPAYDSYEGLCKHCVALCLEYFAYCRSHREHVVLMLLAVDNFFSSEGKHETSRPPIAIKREEKTQQVRRGDKDSTAKTLARTLIESYEKESVAASKQAASTDGRIDGILPASVDIIPTLGYESYRGWNLTFRIGTDERLYVVKSIEALIENIRTESTTCYGKKLTLTHDGRVFTPKASALIKFIEEAREDFIRKNRTDYSRFWMYGSNGLSGKALYLTERSLVRFFYEHVGEQVDCTREISKNYSISVVGEDPMLRACIEADDKYLLFRMKEEFNFMFEGKRSLICMGATVYCCTPEFTADMRTFCKLTGKPFAPRAAAVENELLMDSQEVSDFLTTVLPKLERHLDVTVDPEVDLGTYRAKPPRVEFRLDRQNGNVSCVAWLRYTHMGVEGEPINLFDKADDADIVRDHAAERGIVELLYSFFPYDLSDGSGVCFPEEEDDALYSLLTTGMAVLAEHGEVLASEAFKRITVRTAAAVSVGVSLQSDLLNISIHSDELSFAELRAYLDSYQRKRKFFRMDNGDIVALQEETARAMSDIVDAFDLDLTQIEDGEISLPRHYSLFLDKSLNDDARALEITRDAAFDDLIAAFDTIETARPALPEGLTATLRPYQETGFNWLMTLARLGFGGILADEMGLGKTVQTIAFFAACQHDADAPSLIVCPASLVYNWVQEFARFAPGIDVVAVVGTQEERAGIVASCGRHGVLVTSYDLLKRDIVFYKERRFFCEVIDEAQYIKNQATKSARAVKQVTASVRFALTGTPIENRLSELWSIFDFLMVGFLGRYKDFKARFEGPIVTHSDDAATLRLQRMVKPFILRRLKKDVLTDLPDKNEDIVYSLMEGEQAKLYDATAANLKLTLENQMPDEFASGKIAVLAELTKLRELCCDPHLLYENYHGGSAKLDTCLELIDNAIDGGHKVLVFSQFTSMLAILEEQLRRKKIAYHLLTGATSKERRAQLVEDFQRDDVPVFLISLKAGGTGLNLTAANIVIHYDPWWNLAAQDQATDRTHRIGQDKDVTVFKLIAKDTIEERIVGMQEGKRALADKIIAGEGISIGDLTREDFLELLEG